MLHHPNPKGACAAPQAHQSLQPSLPSTTLFQRGAGLSRTYRPNPSEHVWPSWLLPFITYSFPEGPLTQPTYRPRLDQLHEDHKGRGKADLESPSIRLAAPSAFASDQDNIPSCCFVSMTSSETTPSFKPVSKPPTTKQNIKGWFHIRRPRRNCSQRV